MHMVCVVELLLRYRPPRSEDTHRTIHWWATGSIIIAKFLPVLSWLPSANSVIVSLWRNGFHHVSQTHFLFLFIKHCSEPTKHSKAHNSCHVMRCVAICILIYPPSLNIPVISNPQIGIQRVCFSSPFRRKWTFLPSWGTCLFLTLTLI